MIMGISSVVLGIALVARRDYFEITIRIAGKFGGGKFDKYGKLSVIHQTKTIQIGTYN